MGQKTIIGIGEYVAAKSPQILVTLGLGSCVGVCILDKASGIGGLIHVMLPDSGGRTVAKPGKYADTGIPILIEEMKKLVSHADVITPNFTEAAFLLDREYRTDLENGEIKEWILRAPRADIFKF